MGFSQILAEFAEKFGWPKIRRKKIRLAENPPKKSVSRPNIIKKIRLVGLEHCICIDDITCILITYSRCYVARLYYFDVNN